jgi:hypothetical protein
MTELVEIINPANGRKGKVAATSKAASLYRQPPSARQGDTPAPEPDLPANLGPEKPAKSASTELWRDYASDPRTPGALSPDEAAEMSRDELANHFNKED